MTGIKKWAYGLVSGVITGGATGGLASLGLAGAEAAGVQVHALSLKQLGIVCASAGLISALAYLKQSPLPALDDPAQVPHDPAPPAT